MMFDDGFFADPVECGHGLFVISIIVFVAMSARESDSRLLFFLAQANHPIAVEYPHE
jgi:transcription initiation factor IIF auxiliary subunit